MSEIYKYDNIDYSKLNFSKPEKQNNIYYSDINYEDEIIRVLKRFEKYIGKKCFIIFSNFSKF